MKTRSKDTNGNHPYLAEGESPEGIDIILVGVAKRQGVKIPWRERRAVRNRGRHLSFEPEPEAPTKRPWRSLCFRRDGRN